MYATLERGRVYRLEAGEGSKAAGVAYFTADGTTELDIPITIGSSAKDDPGKIPIEYLTGLSNWPFISDSKAPGVKLASEPGSACVGSTLLASPGLFWPPGTTFTYQWFRNGIRISGATGTTLTLTSVDVGMDVGVHVTGHLAPHHNTAWAAVGTPPTVFRPTRSSPKLPRLWGTPKVGLTLTAKPGAWTSGTSFS